LTTFKVHS